MAQPTLEQLNSWEGDLWRVLGEMDNAYPETSGTHAAEEHALVNCAWLAIRRELAKRERKEVVGGR